MHPQTPPQHPTTSFSLHTPPTPKFAPIDEPDRDIYKNEGKYHQLSRDFSTNDIRRSHEPPVPAAHQQSLTPAETPARKREIDIIVSTHTHGRVLFPTHTPKAGSGRIHHRLPGSQHKHFRKDRESVSTAPSVPQTVPHVRVYDPEVSIKPRVSRNVRIISPSEIQAPAIKKIEVFDETKAFKKELDNEDPLAGIPDPFDSEPIIRKSVRGTASQASSSSASKTIHHPHHPLPVDKPGMWYVFRGKRIFRPFKEGEVTELPRKRLFKEEIERLETVKRSRCSPEPEGNSEEELTDLEDDKQSDLTGSMFERSSRTGTVRKRLFR